MAGGVSFASETVCLRNFRIRGQYILVEGQTTFPISRCPVGKFSGGVVGKVVAWERGVGGCPDNADRVSGDEVSEDPGREPRYAAPGLILNCALGVRNNGGSVG